MKIFTLLIAFSLSAFAYCQTYTFSSFVGGYSNLVASTSLNNGQAWDDPFYNVPIGFNFEYFGEVITSIVISDEGLGGLLKTGDCNLGTNESILFAYGADIIDRGADGPVSLSDISYKTEGTVGARTFKIEWNNVGFYDGSTDASGNRIDYLNFQLWFYETTNVIEIHFGPKSITEPAIDFEGESGSFVALVHNYDCASSTILGHELMLGGTPASPTFYDDVYSLDDTLLYLNGVIPPLTVYRFLPVATSSVDEVSSIPSFSIVPNPAEDHLRIVRSENEVGEIQGASIIDVNGKVLLSAVAFNQEISVANLQPGMYFVQVEMSSGKVYSEKFTKR